MVCFTLNPPPIAWNLAAIITRSETKRSAGDSLGHHHNEAIYSDIARYFFVYICCIVLPEAMILWVISGNIEDVHECGVLRSINPDGVSGAEPFDSTSNHGCLCGTEIYERAKSRLQSEVACSIPRLTRRPLRQDRAKSPMQASHNRCTPAYHSMIVFQ